MGETVNFDNDKAGAMPAGWVAGVTGRGSPKWAIEADASAPSKPHVLRQSGSGTFPYCVLKASSLVDGYVEVKFKPLTGREDQAGGVVWRFKDGDNYYVARANALENLQHAINHRQDLPITGMPEQVHYGADGIMGGLPGDTRAQILERLSGNQMAKATRARRDGRAERPHAKA